MATGYIMLDTPNPYTPQGGLPRRSGFKPTGTCIVHTSEGAWSAGVDSLTNLVRSRTDYGCYHRACDWQDVALYYPWEWECWQDSETNNWAVGIAAACRTEDWGNMPADVEDGFYRNMGRMAADFVAYMRDTYEVEVPRVRITGAQARAGVPGFCAHGDSGISRTDPGARFDWARFFSYTEQALTGTIEEDDMGILDEPIIRRGGGPLDGHPTTLRDVIAYSDANINGTRELIKATVSATAQAVLFAAFDRQGGPTGKTSLAATVAYLDANLGKLDAQEIMDPAKITEAVTAAVDKAAKDALADVSITLTAAGKPADAPAAEVAK